MEDFTIKNPAGLKLAARLYLPPAPHHLLILCHGFRGNKDNHGRLDPFSAALTRHGFGVLAFDFTGCGGSEGAFSSLTLSRQFQDLTAVTAWASAHLQLPLILLGRSFGGSTILSAAGNDSVKGMIFWSAAILLTETFQSSLGKLYDQLASGQTVSWEENGEPVSLEPSFVRDLKSHNPADYFPRLLRKKVLIVQGGQDSVVTPYNAEYLKQNLPQAKLIMVPEADHAFTGLDEPRESLTLDWLKQEFPNCT